MRLGKWLTREQAEKLLSAPPKTLMGLRDRAILGLLIGCGLRRDELANLTFAHLQQREGRWVIVDIVGKGRRVRTVPVPGWAKALVDRLGWSAAELSEGLVLRRFRKGGWLVYETRAEGISEPRGMSADAIADVVATYARPLGWDLAPHDLRRTFAKLARSARRRSSRSSSPSATSPSRPPSATSAPSSTWPTRPAIDSASTFELKRHLPHHGARRIDDQPANDLRSTTLVLWLRVENNNKFVRGKTRVRRIIEDTLLRRYAMRKLGGWEYELTIAYADDAHLERQIDELLRGIWWEADLRHCFIEADVRERGTERSWS